MSGVISDKFGTPVYEGKAKILYRAPNGNFIHFFNFIILFIVFHNNLIIKITLNI
jgi:phosphoribosylaminoimidazole-succinocarboxamide synthase